MASYGDLLTVYTLEASIVTLYPAAGEGEGRGHASDMVPGKASVIEEEILLADLVQRLGHVVKAIF